LGGDFRQTLPVVEHGSIANVIGNSLAESNLFKLCFKTISLTKNMRARG